MFYKKIATTENQPREAVTGELPEKIDQKRKAAGHNESNNSQDFNFQ